MIWATQSWGLCLILTCLAYGLPAFLAAQLLAPCTALLAFDLTAQLLTICSVLSLDVKACDPAIPAIASQNFGIPPSKTVGYLGLPEIPPKGGLCRASRNTKFVWHRKESQKLATLSIHCLPPLNYARKLLRRSLSEIT